MTEIILLTKHSVWSALGLCFTNSSSKDMKVLENGSYEIESRGSFSQIIDCSGSVFSLQAHAPFSLAWMLGWSLSKMQCTDFGW